MATVEKGTYKMKENYLIVVTVESDYLNVTTVD